MNIASNHSIDTFANLVEFFHFEEKSPAFRKCEAVRVTRQLAEELILNNKTMIIGGKVRHFVVDHVGLNTFNCSINQEGNETVYI